MKNKGPLLAGESFTLAELLGKAASCVCLVYAEGASKAVSRPFATYDLTPEVLAHLESRGFKREPRNDNVFTLVDANPQRTPEPGWSNSNYWNFSLDGTERHALKIELSVGFKHWYDRGFALVPQAHGTFLSPVDRLPNQRMFKALVETGRAEVPAVAEEIAASEDGEAIVTWAHLGLGGIKSISALFYDEFARNKKEVRALAEKIFSPSPDPRNQEPGQEVYVIESAQPKLLEIWRDQLEEYRNALTA